METISFARIDINTKKVVFITNLFLEQIKNMQGEIDIQLATNHLKETIPQSKNDLWIKICDDPGKGCGLGYTYDEDMEVFVPPKPFNSWILNLQTYAWDPPIPQSELTAEQIEDGYYYEWNEDNQLWDLKKFD
jgi:hypothetical protein